MKWSYGVTTVEARRDSTLPRTLDSLARAGFDTPRLFVDRGLLAFGNWALAAWELYIREPRADFYAIFQDDILACRGLRGYLERSSPKAGYLNLYLIEDQPVPTLGWFHALRHGKGAQGLVFSNNALCRLLSQSEFVLHPRAVRSSTSNIDGTVFRAMHNAGLKEWAHNPSLLQHINEGSTIVSTRGDHNHTAPTFPGEEVDINELCSNSHTV